MCGPKFCAMKITEEVREAMGDKSSEFAQLGGEVYIPEEATEV